MRLDLDIYMQNAVDCNNGNIVYGEVLVRGFNGINGAPDIIKYIESNKLFVEFDYSIIKATVQYIEETGFSSYPVAVNIMDKTLEKEGIADLILGEIKQHNINGTKIVIEVNENTDIHNNTVVDNIMRLRSGGVLIGVDDLGYGKTTIETMLILKPDIIKVAGELFREESITNEQVMQIIESLLRISNAFGIDPIIEGVENERQLNDVRQLGYKYVQGYIYNRPYQLFEVKKGLIQNKKKIWKRD